MRKAKQIIMTETRGEPGDKASVFALDRKQHERGISGEEFLQPL